MATATKTQLAEQGKQQAALTINNSFIDGIAQVIEDKKKYGLTMPSDYNALNALTGAYLMLKETTDKSGKCILETCTQASIANSLMDMVTMGLNVQKKQGYFIAYGGKCQFQKSYFGNTTIARRYGLKSINADVIYKGDTFKYHKEDAMTVIDVHEQDFMNISNENIIGAYAVAIMNDGTKYCEIMNINQLKAAWNQRQGGLKEESYSTHVKFREEMSKKTVKNRLLKGIINTFGDGYVNDSYEKTEEVRQEEQIEENVTYDIKSNANKETFVEAEEPEVVEEEVVQDENTPF